MGFVVQEEQEKQIYNVRSLNKNDFEINIKYEFYDLNEESPTFGAYGKNEKNRGNKCQIQITP